MTNLPPILVVDVETTGLDAKACGLVEIGAVWLTGPREGDEFQVKCRPPADCLIEAAAMEVNGADWLSDPTVAPEAEGVDMFLDWVRDGPVLLAGMNPRFDRDFVHAAYTRSWATAAMGSQQPTFPFPHRTVDLHSLAISYALAAGTPFSGKGLHTDAILEMLGLPPEPKPHRAIAGARATAAAFRILLNLAEAP